MGKLAQIGATACLTALSASMAAANPLHLFCGTAPVAMSDTTADIPKISTSERSSTAYITGYSYWDNPPPGSSAIARPVIHQWAGGKGTYRDPVTIAVGYRLVGGKARLDYPAGTRVYLPHLGRCAIVQEIGRDRPPLD